MRSRGQAAHKAHHCCDVHCLAPRILSFLALQTYELVNDPSSDDIVSWGSNGRTFIVWKPPEFARDLLPLHFKHNNFSSFVRQLNTYGFRKVDPDRWEFSNEWFMRGRDDLLGKIQRRKPSAADRRQNGE